jgi:hypothetical protein
MTTILIIFSLVVLLFGFDQNRRHESNGSFRERTIWNYIRTQIRQQCSHLERRWCDHERVARAATDRGQSHDSAAAPDSAPTRSDSA